MISEYDRISYLRGMVSETGEWMSGHHAAHTLLVIDEASGVSQHVYTAGQGRMKRMLAISNCNPVSTFHWFRKGCEAGDLLDPAFS